ncbi:putative metabolite transport protein HI_1104 [Condylostylus longicornis]|uniref:putative metabolite transport protein HI_1104 n=1 Tax=Condylostylus longicornis TaxID=2530218 RepID=UPI00244E2BF1|nr:putative metabolite transport protein HI_1104 [Condylostylus longicornis]
MINMNLGRYYDYYVLGILTIGYILGELGHYLIGVTSKQTAIELDYGDHACQQNHTEYATHMLPTACSKAMNESSCYELIIDDAPYCEWNYNGLGIAYQLLAGPAFIFVFTIAGVFLGFAADKYHRVRLLTICVLVFSVAIILQGSVQTYWQLVILRMIMAAGESGCNPLATGIMSDIFPENKRALVMAIFNWGIYGGYGIAFPVGRYITKLNIGDLGWRVCYYGTGVLAVIFGILTGTTIKEPERKSIGENENNKDSETNVSLVKVLLQPRMVLLMIAASIRHSGGMTFAYNADLYYNQYFPDADLGWWLFAVTIGIGGIGVVVGGIVSDKIVSKMGIRSRAACLALSQLIATVPAFGSVYFGPLWAMITLALSYFFAEMWFGIVFAIVVEIVPLKFRSTTIGVFLFVMNNIGGNLPILVDPVAKLIGYRGAIMIFYAGMYGISSILFFLVMFLLDGKTTTSNDKQVDNQQQQQKDRNILSNNGGIPLNGLTGHDNKVFMNDEHLNQHNNPDHHNNYNMQHFLNQQPPPYYNINNSSPNGHNSSKPYSHVNSITIDIHGQEKPGPLDRPPFESSKL